MSATSRKPQTTFIRPEDVNPAQETFEPDRIHLVFGVSPEMNEILKKLALRYRTDPAGVLNLAIGLLNSFADAVDDGKRVGIANDEQELDVEITGL